MPMPAAIFHALTFGHLIKAEEILGLRLVTLHNLHFYLKLMRTAQDTRFSKDALLSFEKSLSRATARTQIF